jgi:hypothetical protein
MSDLLGQSLVLFPAFRPSFDDLFKGLYFFEVPGLTFIKQTFLLFVGPDQWWLLVDLLPSKEDED